MRKLRLTVVGLASCWSVCGAQAQEPEEGAAPDIDFLEYLGAWAEQDDEWLVIEEWQKDAPENDDLASPETKRNEDDESE